MINVIKLEAVKKEIQLKKRTILRIVGRSDFHQNKELGNNQFAGNLLFTDIPSMSTVSSLEG